MHGPGAARRIRTQHDSLGLEQRVAPRVMQRGVLLGTVALQVTERLIGVVEAKLVPRGKERRDACEASVGQALAVDEQDATRRKSPTAGG